MNGKYYLSKPIVELMQKQVPFMFLYESQTLLVGNECDKWNEKNGLMSPIPRMIGSHHFDKHGRSGYVFKDTRVIEDVTIPDDIIMRGYDDLVREMKSANIELIEVNA